METKETIRTNCKRIRNLLNAVVCKELSKSICERIIKEEHFVNAVHVLAYSSIQNEVDLSVAIKFALKSGKKVYLPKVIGDDIKFYEIESLEDCSEGAFHILEPQISKEYKHSDRSVILVPGIAFALDGSRIGFGKGFYDRFLSAHKKLWKIGICYDSFTEYSWEKDGHDINMDIILTDKKEVLCDEFRRIM